MKEAGIDISHHISKSVDGLLASGDRFDYVITVCDSASHACPNLPGNVRTIHQSFDDPPQLVRSASTEAEAFQHYLRVRDEIRDFVRSLPTRLNDLVNKGKDT